MAQKLICFLLLAGCAAQKPAPAQPTPEAFCAVAFAITVDRRDLLTPETSRAIKDHNDNGKRLCGWGK